MNGGSQQHNKILAGLMMPNSTAVQSYAAIAHAAAAAAAVQQQQKSSGFNMTQNNLNNQSESNFNNSNSLLINNNKSQSYNNPGFFESANYPIVICTFVFILL